jgi:hypothetical protein
MERSSSGTTADANRDGRHPSEQALSPFPSLSLLGSESQHNILARKHLPLDSHDKSSDAQYSVKLTQ